MIAFEVKDMTCGHCVSAITKAVRAADEKASVRIDLANQRVEVEPAQADTQQLSDAIREAGYTPVPVAGEASRPAQKARGGCCCG